jgi:hypothetical protein
VKYSSEMQARRRFRNELEQVFAGGGSWGAPITSGQVTYH